ncbi:MAG: HAD family hydrolase [Methanomassiliicoccales archaeon]|nr:MAG: HAD family hydrolase [Methanomassiliicoccales archaeon]
MGNSSWYNLEFKEVLKELDTSPIGLDDKDALARLERYGPNELVEARRKSPLRIFLAQFTNFLVIILLFAAAISAAIGFHQGTVEELYDAVVIMIIVIFNAVFGFIQEYKAEKSLEALKAMAAPQATVIREGETLIIPTRELVPGDVILLNPGTKVAADCRLMEAGDLRINEASLTGESVPVTKSVELIKGKVIISDRRNTAFSGSTVERGRGKGVVTATGMETELGKIAGMVQAEETEQTPLQRRLARLGKAISVAILIICAVVFLVGYLQDPENVVEEFLTAVSLAVAAVPEGLPIVVTISLALGMRRMARRHALIRRLPSVETLGAVTIICSDKTGTLTEGKMNVREIFVSGKSYDVRGKGYRPEGNILLEAKKVDPSQESGLSLLLRAAVLCNDSSLYEKDGFWNVQGDSTEGALIATATRGGILKETMEEEEPRVGEVSFTSERKRMTTFHRTNGGLVAYMKGAPEYVLERCDRYLWDGEPRPLAEENINAFLERNLQMASRGMRILAVAYRQLDNDTTDLGENMEERFVFLGLMGIMDAPRSDAIEAVAECKVAGIKVVMITGDHKLTGENVAKEMGIFEKGDLTVTGSELEKMSDKELKDIVEKVKVYARVSPEHKVRIIKALKAKGHVVAMTGDGVNDAPALKGADIGVAMGITGTDVAKESSEMVLTDDNFASIVKATEEGRVIYVNIRKFVRYMLSTNSGEVMVILVASLLGMPLPLIAIQILWINLITDGFPALSLGVEPSEAGVMKRPPRNPKESIFAGGMAYHIIWVGVLMTVGTLGIFTWGLDGGLPRARTLAFITIALFQLWHVLTIHIEEDTVLSKKFFANPYLLGAIALSVLLQMAVIYVPSLSEVFRTVPLPLPELLLCALVASSLFFAVEAEKLYRRRRKSRVQKSSSQPSTS